MSYRETSTAKARNSASVAMVCVLAACAPPSVAPATAAVRLAVEVGPTGLELVSVRDVGTGRSLAAPRASATDATSLEFVYTDRRGETRAFGLVPDPRRVLFGDPQLPRVTSQQHGILTVVVPRASGVLRVVARSDRRVLGTLSLKLDANMRVKPVNAASQTGGSSTVDVDQEDASLLLRPVTVSSHGTGPRLLVLSEGFTEDELIDYETLVDALAEQLGTKARVSRIPLDSEEGGISDIRARDVRATAMGIAKFGGDGASDAVGNLGFIAPRTGGRLMSTLRTAYDTDYVVILANTERTSRVRAAMYPEYMIRAAANVSDDPEEISAIAADVLSALSLRDAGVSARMECTDQDYSVGFCSHCTVSATNNRVTNACALAENVASSPPTSSGSTETHGAEDEMEQLDDDPVESTGSGPAEDCVAIGNDCIPLDSNGLPTGEEHQWTTPASIPESAQRFLHGMNANAAMQMISERLTSSEDVTECTGWETDRSMHCDYRLPFWAHSLGNARVNVFVTDTEVIASSQLHGGAATYETRIEQWLTEKVGSLFLVDVAQR